MSNKDLAISAKFDRNKNASSLEVLEERIAGLSTRLANVEKDVDIKMSEKHVCLHDDLLQSVSDGLREVRNSMSSWKNLRAGALAAVVVVIVSSVLGAGLFVFQLRTEQEVVKETVSSIKSQVAEVKRSNASLSIQVQSISDKQDTSFSRAMDVINSVNEKLDKLDD